MAWVICRPQAGLFPATTTKVVQLKAFRSATTDFETLLDGGKVLAKV